MRLVKKKKHFKKFPSLTLLRRFYASDTEIVYIIYLSLLSLSCAILLDL